MINASNITLRFGGRELLDSITFVINPKERIGLIGRNGTGKTTLLKILKGIVEPDEGHISHPKDYEIGYLPQEGGAKSNLPLKEEVMKVFTVQNELKRKIEQATKEVEEREDYHSQDYSDLLQRLAELNDKLALLEEGSSESKVEKILLGLGFERNEFDKLCSKFSGGWQMRIELAKILLKSPDLILLDEPTNHLDIESILWLESYLKSYYGAVVIVSHDKRFLDNVTNRTIEIFGGNIFDKKFPYTEFKVQREKDIELQKKAKANQEKRIKDAEKYVEQYRAKARHASRAQSKLKQIEKMDKIEVDDYNAKKIKFNFPAAPRSGRLVAETKGVSKSFGEKQVLKDIDFAIERGEKVAFVGKNGTGKSTFSKILTSELSYDDGDMKIGSNVELGFFRQDQAQILNEEDTVLNTIASVADDEMRPYVRDLLGAFLFSGDDVYKKVKVLSGGERARLSIARLLLERTNFLVMDEPTNHLDIPSKEILKDALNDFGGALIVVSHDRDFLQGLTEKTIEFSTNGMKEYLGGIDYYLEERKIKDISEIELEHVPKQSGNNKSSEKTDAQQWRQMKKDLEKEKRKLNNTISSCEKQISEYEDRLKELDKLFAEPEVYNDQPKLKELKIEYSNIKEEINKLMDNWTRSSEKLEEVESMISLHQG